MAPPLTSIDRSFSPPGSFSPPLPCSFFSRHLKQILKFTQENVKIRSLYYIGASILFGLLYVVNETGCHLKNVAIQRNVPSSSLLRPLERGCRSSDRSIEVSRPARILDTIDCRHPASRTIRGSFNHLHLHLHSLLILLARAGLTNLSVLAFKLNVCELAPLSSFCLHASLQRSLSPSGIRTRSPLLSFPPLLSSSLSSLPS